MIRDCWESSSVSSRERFLSSSGLRTKGGNRIDETTVTQEKTTRAMDPIRAIWPTVSVISESPSSSEDGRPF